MLAFLWKSPQRISFCLREGGWLSILLLPVRIRRALFSAPLTLGTGWRNVMSLQDLGPAPEAREQNRVCSIRIGFCCRERFEPHVTSFLLLLLGFNVRNDLGARLIFACSLLSSR